MFGKAASLAFPFSMFNITREYIYFKINIGANDNLLRPWNKSWYIEKRLVTWYIFLISISEKDSLYNRKFKHDYSLQARQNLPRRAEVTGCERNVRSPGTSFEQAFGDVRMLVPLDRGLSASGSAHNLSFRTWCSSWGRCITLNRLTHSHGENTLW